jgi:hypothetical protein
LQVAPDSPEHATASEAYEPFDDIDLPDNSPEHTEPFSEESEDDNFDRKRRTKPSAALKDAIPSASTSTGSRLSTHHDLHFAKKQSTPCKTKQTKNYGR